MTDLELEIIEEKLDGLHIACIHCLEEWNLYKCNAFCQSLTYFIYLFYSALIMTNN